MLISGDEEKKQICYLPLKMQENLEAENIENTSV